MNNISVQKLIIDSCSVSVCQIVQDLDISINSVDVVIQEYFPSVEGVDG